MSKIWIHPPKIDKSVAYGKKRKIRFRVWLARRIRKTAKWLDNKIHPRYHPYD